MEIVQIDWMNLFALHCSPFGVLLQKFPPSLIPKDSRCMNSLKYYVESFRQIRGALSELGLFTVKRNESTPYFRDFHQNIRN